MRKILIGTILASFSAISFISCTVEPAWKRQEFNVRINSDDSSPGAFKVGLQYAFAQPSQVQDYYTNSFLIQSVYENGLKIRQDGIASGSQNQKDKIFNYKIVEPTYRYKALVNAKAILVTKNDGSEAVFDNDEHEEGYLKQGENTQQLIIDLSSKNPKSINSKKFTEELNDAKKVQIFLKENVKWVDYQGNPTKFDVTPRDYWYGFRFQRLGDPDYRHQNGATEEIDKEASEKIPNFDPKSTYFSNTVINFYLLDLFGFDVSDFDNEDKYIQTYSGENTDFSGKKAITLQKGDKKEKAFFSAFFSQIITNGILRPAPSGFIDERVKKEAKMKDGKLVGAFGETGDALKFGYYWYTKDFKNDQLYNSPYTQTHWDRYRQSWKINKYYPRTGWQESLPYIFTKINNFYSKYNSPSDFANSQFNSYREGTIMGVSFNSLNDSQKNLVASDQAKFGWELSRQISKNSLEKWYYSLLVPGSLKQKFSPETGVSFNENYYAFNDNFSKLNYGVSRKELASGGAKIIDYISSGVGLEFRQIIANAWNLYTTAQAGNLDALAWYNFVAPDNKINSVATSKTPRDYYKIANTIKLVDQNGKVYYQKDPESERKQNFANVKSAKLQFQAPEFAVLKAKMKAILDKFYAENKISASEKVSWTSHSFYINTNSKWIAAITNAAEAIKSLDPRLEFKLNWPITDQARRKNYLFTRTGGLDYGGWGYDYDGIGSGFDGRIQRNGVGYAILSSIFARGENSEIAKSYPQTFKYAKAIKDYFEAFAQKGLIRTFESWKDAPNAPDFGADDQNQKPNLINFFIGSVVESDDPKKPGQKIKTWKSFVDQQKEKKSTESHEDFDFYSHSATFNLKYQETTPEKDLVELSAELTSLLTPGITDLLVIPSTTPFATLVNPNIIDPYNDYYGTSTPDMILIKPLLEKARKGDK
ncbi:OppA family ABC transporter substrate-binding lipoprotein [Mycoplasma sp. 'Moose RK']|uniref:OppA family ABC transporter substrate-binding lipoprotein n=1 Tax=Mycoplasma sp. 'Moose RK' TaxID=2780095 RepID=UPI0018C2917C|nr:hypothetical protein [Mycoplasma sp. 'Moose RK']MBG0730570.1 hypothetical protein [Mycoplasma sp. 'Moose RK']